MSTRNLVLVVGLAVGMAFVGGCEEKNNPAPKTTDAIKDAAKSGTNAVTDAAKTGTEAVKDAAKTGTDAVKSAADAGAAKLKEAQAAASSWMSDTVEKKWPEMKTELEGYAKKVTDIKDPGVKTQAEGLVKDLQAQIPAIEKAVTDLKSATAENSGAMLDSAKKAWDGFAAKLSELKKLIPA